MVVPLFSLFLRLGVEKSGRQTTAHDFDKEVAEVRETAHGVNVQIQSVNDTMQDMYDIRTGVSDGTQVTPDNYLRQAERFIYSGAEKTSRPMASDFGGDLTRS